MPYSIPTESAVCAALTAVSGALLAWRPPVRWARPLWVAVALAGLTHALVLNVPRHNLLGTNLVHYYLGAKYPIPYARFYEAIQAAQDLPAVGIRDLDHPDRMARAEPAARRAFYIDMLRSEGKTFGAQAPTESLATWARNTGAISRESDRILRRFLSDRQIAAFREDVRAAVANTRGRALTDDFGFNGSPFYALVRHLDPTLYRPFGPLVGWVNLAWQLVALILLAWIAGEALGLSLDERLVACALLLSSYDFVAWVLPGLVFGELWLPVALAVLAMRQRRAVLAGVAVAWAGLIKLFPFVLVLPALVVLIRARTMSRATAPGDASAWSARFVASCLLAAAALVALSLLTGRSWAEFLHKIGNQFQGASVSVNSVSLAAALQELGLHDSPANALLAAIAIGFLAALFFGDRDEEFFDALPRRGLVLVAATGWITHSWFNYYGILPCLLLPLYARRHRVASSVAVFGMAASALLPSFTDPVLLKSHVLTLLKLLPYLVIPAWMVALELAPSMRAVAGRRVAVIAIGVATLVTAFEVWRVRTVDRLEAESRARLDAEDPAGALPRLDRLVALSPRNVSGLMNRGVALASLGRNVDAEVAFRKAAALAPDFAPAQDNYGRFLMATGRLDAAERQLERARVVAPDDPEILTVLARIRLERGDSSGAVRLLTRARELNPGDSARRGP